MPTILCGSVYRLLAFMNKHNRINWFCILTFSLQPIEELDHIRDHRYLGAERPSPIFCSFFRITPNPDFLPGKITVLPLNVGGF